MMRSGLAVALALALWPHCASAESPGLSDLYTTRALVTGKDERNRPLGFRLCFDDVLVKVSGDPGIADDGRVAEPAAHPERFITGYSYRDRLEGKPNHDEQGTYDRPFFITCMFDPAKIDAILGAAGRKPWLGQRPRVAMILAVHGRTASGLLTSDGAFDPDMRASLSAAVARYGLAVDVPPAKAFEDLTLAAVPDASLDRLRAVAARSGDDLPLLGDLTWSDEALGWVATWRLGVDGGWQRWTIGGVNYDEAFRDGVRGAASVLSGHGPPQQTP